MSWHILVTDRSGVFSVQPVVPQRSRHFGINTETERKAPMQKLLIFLLALLLMHGAVQAQSECDIAGGAVRLHMTSEACKLPLNNRGKAALAVVQTRPAVMACMPRALGRVKAELQEALRTGGEPGVKLWCDLQRETLKGMLE